MVGSGVGAGSDVSVGVAEGSDVDGVLVAPGAVEGPVAHPVSRIALHSTAAAQVRIVRMRSP
ncbi:hypothetical protein [Leucobacter alluvii]|uniref:hypothetical protein n=1 Tax=Leucobacter alluvii TaxID=340321 RepID=UPI0031FA30DF